MSVLEVWKDINGYEGHYQVSNLGKIKSLNFNNTSKEKMLKCCNDNRGYLVLNLSKNGKYKRFQVHLLVAQAFLELDIDDSKMFVCHHDDNPLNNSVDNLFLGNNYDNVQDMIKKERGIKGESVGTSKLKNYQVLKILALKGVVSERKIARIFNITHGTVGAIFRGKTWKHVTINNTQ